MTYRELIEICYRIPEEDCYNDNCLYKKECAVLRDIVGECPSSLYDVLGIDFDGEISDAETVEVTYCRDCTYYNSGWCSYYDSKIDKYDYCSKAKRKEDEE